MVANMPGVEQRIPYQPKARWLQVSRIEELSTTMRRFWLTGNDLEDRFPFRAMGVSDHVKLAVPLADIHEPAKPADMGTFGPDDMGRLGLVMRTYTIRAWNPDARELALDCIRHDEGPAGRWTSRAVAGDHVIVLGPRGNTVFSSDYETYVIVVDETGLPAAARWIEEAPMGSDVRLVVAVAGNSARIALPERERMTVQWVERGDGGDVPAEVERVLADTRGKTLLWCAGEASAVQRIRGLLQDSGAGIEASLHGYWRSGEPAYHEGHAGGHAPRSGVHEGQATASPGFRFTRA